MPTEIWALRLRFSASRLGFVRRSWFWAVRLFFEPSSFDCNQQLKKSLHTIFIFHGSQISVLYRIKYSSCLCHSANEYKIWHVKTIYTIFFILYIQRFFIEIKDLWLVINNFLHRKMFFCTICLGNVRKKDAKLMDFW